MRRMENSHSVNGYFLSIFRVLRLFFKYRKMKRTVIRRVGYFLSIIRVLRLFFKIYSMNTEFTFGGWLFSKYLSGFEVIFQNSFFEYRTFIRRGGHFLGIIRGLRLFLKYHEVKIEPSLGGLVIF